MLAQDLEEREQLARAENDRFRQRYDLDENIGNPDAARLKIQVAANWNGAGGPSPRNNDILIFPTLLSSGFTTSIGLTRVRQEIVPGAIQGQG